jgi:hypothetical protein
MPAMAIVKSAMAAPAAATRETMHLRPQVVQFYGYMSVCQFLQK